MPMEFIVKTDILYCADLYNQHESCALRSVLLSAKRTVAAGYWIVQKKEL